MTNAPQEMIGKYRIIAKLASGSQGTVYRAYDPTLEREVALKVLHPHLATPDVIERFRREGRIVASINSPNIAGISEIGEHNGAHFIAIEYVPHAASELIRRGPMDVVHAASIAHQAALALEAARVSRHGITHHDVKPDNLLLTSLDIGGAVKLIDFGIAHAEGMASMTQAGSKWGTPFYMPPEQWAGERGDTRSDVYSLGVVMYQMLAGRVPFDSDAENALAQQKAIADQHLETAPAPLRSAREDVPEELDALVAKCMAKSPDERCQTPGELANALAAMFGLAAPTASIAATSRPSVQISPEPAKPARRPSAPRPSRPARQLPPIFDMLRLPEDLRNRMPLIAAGGFGALVVILTLIVMASRPGDDAPPLPPRVVIVSPPTATPTPAPVPTRTTAAPARGSAGFETTPTPTATPSPAVSAVDFIRSALSETPIAPPPVPTRTPTPAPTRTPAPTSTPTPTPAPTATPTPDNPNAMADLRPIFDSFRWSPASPSVGDTVTFTVEIRNDGQRNAGASLLAYSVDGIDGAKSGEVRLPPIAAGGSVEATFTWKAEAGHHNVGLEVDAEHRVREQAEGNNTITQGLIYYGTALADLSVVSIEWTPEKPELGEEVAFAATVSNTGEGRAQASNLRFSVDGESVGLAHLPPIPAGGTASAAFEWTARAGAHTLSAVADDSETVSETNESNNALSEPYDATIFVDLSIESVTWAPERPSVGDSVTFAVTVINGGNMDAGEFAVVLGGVDVVDDSVVLSRVPAGGSSVAEFAWTATPDEFNLIAIANDDGALREITLDNNRAEKAYAATVLPDLVLDEIAWSPENPALGDEITATITVKNEGEGRAGATSVQFFVNDAGDWDKFAISELEAGESAEASFAWTAQKGKHEFSAFVNRDESVIETQYGNNDASAQYDNTRLANLTVDSATWSPRNPAAGDALTFTAKIRNRGDADATAFRVEFRDESGGWRLDDFVFPNGIAAKSSADATFSWRADAAAHKFVVRADSTNVVDESNESDNALRFAYNHTRTADLFIRDIEWSPQTPTLGADVTVTAIVANGGTSDSKPSVVHFVINGPSRATQTLEMPAIAAGDSARRSFKWTAQLGRFTFTATADATNQVPETNEGNNTLVNNYNDTVQPDLVVDRIEVIQDDPAAGSEVEIRALIRNVGDGEANRFRVVLHVNGNLLDSDRIDWLPAGDDAWARFSITWTYSGQVTFAVTADSEGAVAEKSETNNRYETRVSF